MKNGDEHAKKYQLLNAQILNIIAFAIPAIFSLENL